MNVMMMSVLAGAHADLSMAFWSQKT